MITATHMNTIGLDTGLVDKNGEKIHLGDTLVFDPIEWGGENMFTLAFEDGELNIGFGPDDLKEFCHIVKKWNEE